MKKKVLTRIRFGKVVLGGVWGNLHAENTYDNKGAQQPPSTPTIPSAPIDLTDTVNPHTNITMEETHRKLLTTLYPPYRAISNKKWNG